ncbi:hypothetical protein POUND7_003749 [Theobroma cacao]
MEDGVILREWFGRVDSEKTGSITATQLKSAFAIGNLDFPLSVVQQMIRFSSLYRNRGFLATDDVYEALNKIGFSLDTPAFYAACESFDQKKNGRLQLDDFISLCIFLQSARNLFNAFDTAKQGRVTLDLNQFVYCGEYPKFEC